MRSPREKFYDNMYYSVELAIFVGGINVEKCLAMMRVKVDKEFHQIYKNTILPYWAQYGVRPHKWWYKQYYLRKIPLDPRLIPNDLYFTRINRYFNNMYFISPLPDKNLHNLLFAGVKRPETVFKFMDGYYCDDDFTPLSEDEVLARCALAGDYVIKPTRYTNSGQDIQFLSGSMGADDLKKLASDYKGDDYIVQRRLLQHPDLARLNASSINTVRFITLALPSGTHILSTVLRVGAPGSNMDNISQGGYQCAVRPDGTLDKTAYTHINGNAEFVEQTQSGIRFEGYRIPSWEKLRDTAIDLATRMPHLRLVGWDLAVDPQGDVVLVEFNARPEQNQSTNGPTFGDMTDEILTMVFGKKK